MPLCAIGAASKPSILLGFPLSATARYSLRYAHVCCTLRRAAATQLTRIEPPPREAVRMERETELTECRQVAIKDGCTD